MTRTPSVSTEIVPCRLIYTFLLGRPHDDDPSIITTSILDMGVGATTVASPTIQDSSSAQIKRGDVYPTSQLSPSYHEKDVLFFNVNETDGIGKRWGWFRYYAKEVLPHILPASRDNVMVGFTDTFILLKPSEFWNHPLLNSTTMINSNHIDNVNNNHSQSLQQRHYVYAGLPMNRSNSECSPPSQKCASLRHPMMIETICPHVIPFGSTILTQQEEDNTSRRRRSLFSTTTPSNNLSRCSDR